MTTFNIIFPLIFVVAAGYNCARSGFMSRSQIEGLSRLTFSLIMPVFLFINMATADLAAVFDLKVFASFYIPVFSVYLLSIGYHYYFDSQKPKQLSPAAVFGLTTGYSNMVLVGMPIVMAALGQQVIGSVFLLISFHGVLLFGSTIILSAISTGKDFSLWQTMKDVCSNPVVGSIWIGLLVNFIGIQLPQIIIDSLRFFSKPGITLALFVLGTSLHFYSVKGKLGRIGAVTAIKLLLTPAIVWYFAHTLFALEPILVNMAVLLSASPTGINAYLIATQQRCHEALVASTVVVSTFMCMFSFSFWLWLLL